MCRCTNLTPSPSSSSLPVSHGLAPAALARIADPLNLIPRAWHHVDACPSTAGARSGVRIGYAAWLGWPAAGDESGRVELRRLSEKSLLLGLRCCPAFILRAVHAECGPVKEGHCQDLLVLLSSQAAIAKQLGHGRRRYTERPLSG